VTKVVASDGSAEGPLGLEQCHGPVGFDSQVGAAYTQPFGLAGDWRRVPS
jgi:hypothetical protein